MRILGIVMVCGLLVTIGCQKPPQNTESSPSPPHSNDVIGVETVVVSPPSPTVGSAPVPPAVTKPLWMLLPKSWHRDCKRWIKPIAGATVKYGDPQDHPLMYAAQVRQESRCDPSARSHVGASGILQIMPATAREIAKKWGEGSFNVWSAADNIKAGLWYDQRTRRFWNPNYRSWCSRVWLMFAGYNSGNGWWHRAQKKCAKDTGGSCNDYMEMAEFFPAVNPVGAHENLNYVRIISKSWHSMMGDSACKPVDGTVFLK